MEEVMRCELACLPHVYLTIDRTNRNMASFLGITVHFIDTKWTLRIFVLIADSFLDMHRAFSIAKSYDNINRKVHIHIKSQK